LASAAPSARTRDLLSSPTRNLCIVIGPVFHSQEIQEQGGHDDEDQIDEIVSATAAAIEAEVEKMICALPDGFDTTDAVTRLAEFLNHDKPFGALISKWRVANLTIELLETENR
jgi:hypothetical protein